MRQQTIVGFAVHGEQDIDADAIGDSDVFDIRLNRLRAKPGRIDIARRFEE
jgi:hypothetical protein